MPPGGGNLLGTVVTTKRVPATKKAPARTARKSSAGTSTRAKKAPAHRAPTATKKTGATGSAEAKGGASTSIFAKHSADLWAVGLITVGVLLGLAVYGHALGPIGHAVDTGLGTAIGWARYVMPLIMVGAGALILAERRNAEPVRTVFGAGLGLLGVCGLAELCGGSPRVDSSTSALSGAGGWLGALFGHPLQAGIGTAGAAVVCVALIVVAVILATNVTLASIGRGIGRGSAALGHAALGWWSGGTMPKESAEEDDVVTAAVPPRRARKEVDPLADVLPPELPLVPEPSSEMASPDLMADTGPVDVVPSSDPDDDLVVAATVAPSAKQTTPEPAVKGGPGEWTLPPLSLLKRSKEQHQDERQLDAMGEELVRALAAHGVETRLLGRTVGPTVTRFELELGAGVKVARVTSLSKDIAYAMASPDVRILAPIPGKSAIGVEVPNRTRQLVALGDILTSEEAAEAEHPLEVALGRDIAGRAVMVNLASMPHVLISGATGAGKSSCINSLLTSILMRSTPDQVRMILIDPKRVELGQYNGLPHLLSPVVVDPKKAANALSWAVKEMERRYDLLAEYGVRDITGYNDAYDDGELGPIGGVSVQKQVAQVAARAKSRARAEQATDQPFDVEEADSDQGSVNEAALQAAPDVDEDDIDADRRAERLPFILIVVDELNDLMMVAARDVEESVVRIAQMARAVGIHLVLATQRPSVDVITGVIKANVPSRMAFSVSSLADSRVILDQPGAERLIGKGDMLILTASSNIARRLQGPWVSEEEVRSVVASWQRQGGATETVVGIEGADDRLTSGSSGSDDDDELLAAAMDLVVRSQLGSTSMLQRKLRVGFARAGRLMDLLEQRGVVGPSEGSKARAVLMSVDELDATAPG
jgi:DNA segregation ATPase FtsK/SpoIIIE, S-DNA-T family